METVTLIFTTIVSFVLPFAALAYFAYKKDGLVRPFICGVCTFLVFQILTRIPLIQIISGSQWYVTMYTQSPILYALFLGVTAALFEELGRYLVMKKFMTKNRRFIDAVAFGIGHGGLEAIVFTGLNALLMLVGAVAPQIDALGIFLGGIERLCAICFHSVFSLMVMYSIVSGKRKYLLLALGGHTALDAGVFLLSATSIDAAIVQAVLIGIAIVMLTYAKTLYGKFKEQNKKGV